MRVCTICKLNISHKKSNSSSKCDKCVRRINGNSLKKVKKRMKNMRTTKREILKAYNISCVICGWKIEINNAKGMYLHQRGCEIHHIQPISEGGKDVFENCILLCPNHHKEADLGLIKKEELYSYVIKNKEKAIEDNKLKNQSDACDILDSLF
jgi:predicted restriction endonuclease